MKEILEEWVETNSENDFQSYKRKGENWYLNTR